MLIPYRSLETTLGPNLVHDCDLLGEVLSPHESFERVIGRYPGEEDIESGGVTNNAKDMGMEGFFNKVAEIEKQIERISTYFNKLQTTNEESKLATKASEMKAIKQKMEKDVEEVKKIAYKIKTLLEELDKDNINNRQKSGCEKGTAVDRSRVGMTVALKKKLKERMLQFQTLRQDIHDEYREVVERRVFTGNVYMSITGKRLISNNNTVDQLIETGHSEQIFEQAIHNCGRGLVVDTLAEIQERHDTVLELEKKLIDLQQMFLDMAVLVDAQGDMLNDIEAQVTKSVDHIEKATVALQEAKKKQKNTRKYMCIAIIILIIVIFVALGGLMKGANKSV
ncbi:syntaxin-132 [Canna indica]|uniref:Syntaxin-132 n=1 Tax=Canna indica TaxID=4628 RepID=A0AAQ3KFF9_9LILI|nr:syntaxin-132 [Canna indica]